LTKRKRWLTKQKRRTIKEPNREIEVRDEVDVIDRSSRRSWCYSVWRWVSRNGCRAGCSQIWQAGDPDRDPLEIENRIEDPESRDIRDFLHDKLLEELDRSRDPFRSFNWGQRTWRSVRNLFYFGGVRRIRPTIFPFRPECIEADGTLCEKVE